jgi:hypothetical protein
VLDLAGKVRYVVDPQNEYPRNYTGHLRAVLRNGQDIEIRQPYLRGGTREPLPQAEIVAKFRNNVAFGGWSQDQSKTLMAWCGDLFDAPDLNGISAFRT